MPASFKAQLKKHVRAVHKIDTFSTFLRQIVLGGSDGIVTTFAVIAGFTGAQTGEVATYSIITVLLFGLANLFADGTSMAVGEFLSSRSEHDIFRKQRHMELNDIRTTL
jgi:VIT1/CCC1 family predicted Fe2+/Mn2+ transporter